MDEIAVVKYSMTKEKKFGKKRGGDPMSEIVTIRPGLIRRNRRDFSDPVPIRRVVNDRRSSGINAARLEITEAILKDLETYIVRGCTLPEACRLAGIPYNRFNRWKEQYPDFEEFVKTCEAKAKYEALEQISTAREGGVWQAASWFLERKYPAEFGRKDMTRHQIVHEYQEFIKIVLEVLNEVEPELRARVVDRLRDKNITIED